MIRVVLARFLARFFAEAVKLGTAAPGVSVVKITIELGVPVKDRPVKVSMDFWKISEIVSRSNAYTAESGVAVVKKTVEVGVPVKDRPVAVSTGF